MAFTDKAPSAWLGAGYVSSTGKIELNTNNAATNKLLPELTDSEANATTGDVRKLMFGLIDGIHKKLDAKNTALASADRPSNFTFSKSATVNPSDGTMLQTYTFNFRLGAPATLEVADEPV
jgi:hypothetical protein